MIHQRHLKILLVTTLVAAILMVFAGTPSAQDTHYWTQQYGIQGDLLLGTVVGSIIDLSSVYYNPGTLALQQNPSIILGAKAFEYQSITFENTEGIQAPLQSQSFGPAPTLFAGTLPSRWLDGQLGYSVLTRNAFKFKLQTAGSGDFEPDFADSITQAGGEVYVDQDMIGVWGGPTWSRAWGKMGVGVTGFIAYQGQSTRNQLILQGLRPSGRGASATFINSIDYWHVRLVFKAGVAWDYSPLTFGFAFTAPSIGLFGQGSTLLDFFAVNIDVNDDGVRDTELIANYTTDQEADYRSPASLAGGASYRYKNTTIHASAEYFGPVGKYEVLPTQFFTSPTTGKHYAQTTTLELNSVFNWGIGVGQHIRDWLKAYGSFIVDNSAYVDGTSTNVAVSNWDLKHLTGGTAFSFHGNDITLGIGYSWGSESVPKVEHLESEGGRGNIPTLDFDGVLNYRKWKIIVGFAFGAGTSDSGS